jgi:hypothetical protein
MNLEPLAVAAVMVSLVMLVAFYQMLRHQRRAMIHKERLAAIDKGVELPSFDQESPKKMSWNTQQLLLLAGLVWMSVGFGLFVVLMAVISGQRFAPPGTDHIPPGVQFIGVAPFLIGVSHVIVYLVGRAKDRER